MYRGKVYKIRKKELERQERYIARMQVGGSPTHLYAKPTIAAQ